MNTSNDLLGGLPIHVSPLVPSELPVLTFDPLRKCTWATPEFRGQMDKWLLDRFGKKAVAFAFNPRALGLRDGQMLFVSPKHAAMLGLRNLGG